MTLQQWNEQNIYGGIFRTGNLLFLLMTNVSFSFVLKKKERKKFRIYVLIKKDCIYLHHSTCKRCATVGMKDIGNKLAHNISVNRVGYVSVVIKLN